MKKLVTATLLLTSPLALGETTPEPWGGEGDLAYSRSSGNTDNQSLLAKLKLIYRQNDWVHTGQMEAVNSSEDGTRSAESYTLRYQSDYSITETWYAFGKGRYEDNRFSGYEYRATLAGGIGAHLIDDDVTTFNLEGGVGYRHSKEQNTGVTSDEAVIIGHAHYARVLTETTRFESNVDVESGADNTYIDGEMAVRVKINARLGLKVAYSVEHNTDVPVGTEKTDTLTSVGLNYSF